MKKAFRSILPAFVILTMLLAALPVHSVQAVSANVVISQVYGGGGNSGATLKNDFIELYNLGSTAINVTGWTVQYASSAGSSWQKTALSGTIQPGAYYLVQEAAGAGGTVSLPTPDAIGSIAMGASAGKVALVSNSTTLTGTCPTGLVDFVGFGSATNCSETTPTANLSNTTAALRKSNGAQDTDNNSADFVIGAPNPRNSFYPMLLNGLATPNVLFTNDPVLLTVAVSMADSTTLTGTSVTCDLSSLNGLSSQEFYDDGTNGDVTAGDNTFSFATTIAGSVLSGAKTLLCSVTNDQGITGTTKIPLSVTSVLPIGTVNGKILDTDNGATHVSLFNGQVVTIQGVIYEKTLQAISNTTDTYKGFFIQNTSANADGDVSTSDGLFVFMNKNATIGAYSPTVGDEVILSGTVSEYYNMTELTNPSFVKLVRTGVDFESEVAPVVANPPTNLADANRYWERLQGMRVQVPQNSVVLGGRNVFSPADAEVWVAAPDSTVALRSGYEQRAFRDSHPLDDNYNPTLWDGNGYRILMGSLGIKAAAGDAQTLIDPARTFDTVTSAPAGGLNYTFSKYRIEISDQPAYSEGIDPSQNNPVQAIEDRAAAYSIVDYNLENLYDYRNNPFSGCDFTGDTGCFMTEPFLADVKSPFDYVPKDAASYEARVADIASQIINDLHEPDILMLQEVENQDFCAVADGALTCGTTDNADGKPDVLQDLALEIAAQGGPVYDAAFDRDSSDLRGILPAYLYRTDRVELLPAEGDLLLGTTPAINYAGAGVLANSDVSNPKTLNAVLVLPEEEKPCETSWVFPRAPSVALFRIYSESVGVGSFSDVYTINNHFKSGPDTCVSHRTEQAKYNAAIISYIESVNPLAQIVMGGDLNVYPNPDNTALGAPEQLGSLYAPELGLKNLWEVLLAKAPASAYSYVYLGMAQTLDQMFVNAPLLAELQQFRIAHINSDFPAEYPGDIARGTSDHDPNVATFLINQPPTVNANGPYSVDEGSTVTLNATGLDPEGSTLTYAWDLDNDGTFETPGQSVSFTNTVDGPAAFTVKVQATDAGNASSVAETTVMVNNVAPTLGALNAPTEPLAVGMPVEVSADFTDPGILDTHTVSINWGDGITTAGTVEELDGSGTASGSHSYTNAGFFTITMTVTDKDGGVSNAATSETIIIYNPANFITGSGWFKSPVDSFKAKFDVTAMYKKDAVTPDGQTELILGKNTTFLSTGYDWLVQVGNEAVLKGTGTINGTGEYFFLITEKDGSPDQIKILIWDASGIVYDTTNLVNIGGGSITLH
ncbi:MAG: PKD domain-containing protein [Anaerolineaceae bacterium]